MILYTYYRSSAAYRARLALSLKNIAYESRFVHLLRQGGEQLQPDYRRLNPLGRVPTLIDGEQVLTQSLAIIEYLDETHPVPALLPRSAADRALARAIAHTIASDMQPLQNLAVTRYLAHDLRQSKAAVDAWTVHWMSNGLHALETLLRVQSPGGNFCVGDFPTLADICLVAQCTAARRFNLPIHEFESIARIDAHCRTLVGFQAAAPEMQADFEPQ